MEYKELSKIYYADSSSDRDVLHEREYRRRFESESTFKLGFDTPQGELFLATPRELVVLGEDILRAERVISSLFRNLPTMAAGAVLRGLVIDEVVCTNAIEDIRSTRQQVKEALDAVNASVGGKRFRELAMLYLGIVGGKAAFPATPEDIRSVYDEVTRGEIPPDKLPDGRLFRASGVDIVQGGLRVVHRGLEPEGRIIDAVSKMIEVSKSREIPALYRSVAAHYLFEYIHPFYDGNGRTGRYLLSLLLSESLSPATALSLSRVIAQNREEYYRAFKTVEKRLNCGELTFFVHSMFELIREAQIRLEDRAKRCTEALGRIDAVVGNVAVAENLKEREARIIRMLMQYGAFGLIGDASLSDIAMQLGVKQQMARKHVSSLEEKGMVVKRNKRNPVTFALSDEFKVKYEGEELREIREAWERQERPETPANAL